MRSKPDEEMISQRIRSLRKQRGWTLAKVEKLSRGSIKAVVLGSYERGDRAMSLGRVIQLADIFEVPLSFLLCEPKEVALSSQGTLIIDLRRVRALPKNPTKDKQTQDALASLIFWIAQRRSDWNGEVMSLRTSDLSTLSLMADCAEEEIIEWLQTKKLLFTGPNHP